MCIIHTYIYIYIYICVSVIVLLDGPWRVLKLIGWSNNYFNLHVIGSREAAAIWSFRHCKPAACILGLTGADMRLSLICANNSSSHWSRYATFSDMR